MNLGALAIGLCLGVALWIATDNVVFISVGLAFAIAFGLFDKSGSDEPGDDGTDTDPADKPDDGDR